ncbi:MAG: hypothetical protein ACLU5F_04415 [Anaerovoracaceae bacterium]
MKNRRGDEIVEAAMVLPVLILTVLSLILLLIYFFSCLSAQVELHGQMAEESIASEKTFDIIKKKTETSSKVGGAVDLILKKETEGRIYVVSGADIIRAGKLIGFEYEE